MVRDLLLGRTRFKDFQGSPEKIPTNTLSDRLNRLVEVGIAEQEPVEKGARRKAYRLTEKGKALRSVILALRDWGLEWEEGTEARLS